MSQEKVDRYKKEKANRQQIMKKERRTRVLSSTALIAAIGALAVWFGVSVYNNSKADEVLTYSMNYTSIDNYLSNLSS